MSKFSTGDIVVRIESRFLGMDVGDIATVRAIDNYGDLYLYEYNGKHSAVNFKLVKSCEDNRTIGSKDE